VLGAVLRGSRAEFVAPGASRSQLLANERYRSLFVKVTVRTNLRDE
jgi:hypothetical protein